MNTSHQVMAIAAKKKKLSAKILNQNPRDVPMNTTDFYLYLCEDGYEDNKLTCIRKYLENSYGLTFKEDFITGQCLSNLKHIYEFYWYEVKKPERMTAQTATEKKTGWSILGGGAR